MEKIIIANLLKRTFFFWKKILLVLSMWKLALGYGMVSYAPNTTTKNLYEESSCQVWSSTLCCERNP
jgi:hypothetical protein